MQYVETVKDVALSPVSESREPLPHSFQDVFGSSSFDDEHESSQLPAKDSAAKSTSTKQIIFGDARENIFALTEKQVPHSTVGLLDKF